MVHDTYLHQSSLFSLNQVDHYPTIKGKQNFVTWVLEAHTWFLSPSASGTKPKTSERKISKTGLICSMSCLLIRCIKTNKFHPEDGHMSGQNMLVAITKQKYINKIKVHFLTFMHLKLINTYFNMIALSTENVLLGSPQMFHCLISTASPSTVVSVKSSEHVIWRSRRRCTHEAICCSRNCSVKAPRYATTPEQISTSPSQWNRSILYISYSIIVLVPRYAFSMQ